MSNLPNRLISFKLSLTRSVLLILTVFALSPPFASGQEYDRLDPVLKRLTLESDAVLSPALRPLLKTTGSRDPVDVFIRAEGRTSFSTEGINIKTVLGDLVVASVPVDQLSELSREPGVQSVHIAKVWTTRLDRSVAETRVDSVRTPYNNFGAGVIIGVVDTGIDWRHKDFRVASDTTKTRIKFLWDMSDNTGPPPTGFATSGGTEYTETRINQAITGTATVNEKDDVGHGTHVAGIAAGTDGMAPLADLIVVKATRSNALSFSSSDVVTAMNYIDAKAATLGKPYVINLSLGGQQGSHDGRAAEDQGIDNLVGAGKNGKVVVAAAGNEGNKRIHSSGTMNSNSVIYESRSFTADAGLVGQTVSIDLWTQVSPNNPNTVFVRVAGPDTSFESSGFPPAATNRDNTDGTISIFSSPFPVLTTGTDINTDIQITIKKQGTWTVSIRGSRGSGSGNFDMWIYGGRGEWNSSDGDFSRLVGTPGSAKNAITVGAYVSKASWTDADGGLHTATSGGLPVIPGARASFSSPGPSRDGRLKPEISAPGQVIASSLSADAIGSSPSIFSSSNILAGRTRAVAQGTSMATPHVAGAVALVLAQAVKDTVSLNAIQVRNALQTTARTDLMTGTTPNNEWGHGKIDVDSLFSKLFGPPRGANAVSLTSFIAETEGRRVRLSWRIAAFSNHAGFHIYRSSTGLPTDRIPINSALLTGSSEQVFFDSPPAPGNYHYWLADVDAGGLITFHGPLVVLFRGVPAAFRLEQNHPNPFNPTTTIHYDIPTATHVTIRIYDVLGRLVKTLVNGFQPAGFHQAVWDSRNSDDATVGAGVYFYTLVAGEFVQSRKMTLLK